MLNISERKPITSCMNITIETNYSSAINNHNYNLSAYAMNALEKLAETCKNDGINFKLLSSDYTSNLSSSINYQMTPPENAIDINGMFNACTQSIKSVRVQNTILEIANQVINGAAVNTSVTSQSCCKGAKGYCCPDGHWLNDLHQGSYICCK